MTTLQAMATGALAADPEGKTSASGKAFTKAALRHTDGGTTTWVRVVAFGVQADELAALRKGDALCVVGRAKVAPYLDKQQQPAASLEIVAERVTYLRPGTKPREAAEATA